MTDIKKICDAMAALAAAIPGTCQRAGMVQVSLHSCDEATLRLLAEAGGTRETCSSTDGAEEWDYVDLYGAVTLTAFGRHRPIATAALDSATVDSALALAEEAVRP